MRFAAWAKLACAALGALPASATNSNQIAVDVQPNMSDIGNNVAAHDIWIPRLILEVGGVTLFPASPKDDSWSFFLTEGHVCTLSPGQICCEGACLVLNNSISESKNYKLGGVNVTLNPRNVEPFPKDANLTEILATFSDEHSAVDNADAAAGKMFEFAIKAIEQINPTTSLLSRFRKRSTPKDVVDAAASAVVEVDRLISTERNTLMSWVDVTDRVKVTPGNSGIDQLYQQPTHLIRGALNRMHWFKVVGKNIHANPSQALLLANMVLYELGANHNLLEDVEPELSHGLHGIIPRGFDVFVEQTGLRRNAAFEDIQQRASSIMFATYISAQTYSAFCLALDGNVGKRDADPGSQVTFYPSYFTSLTEREYNLLLHTSFVKEVIIQPLARELHEVYVNTRSDMVKVKSRALVPDDADGKAKRLLTRDEESKTTTQEDSESPLTSVSQMRDLPLAEQNYTYTSPAGKGVTIFIIGGGVRFNNEDISSELRLDTDNPTKFYHSVPAYQAVPADVNDDYIEGDDQVIGHWDEESWNGETAAMAALAAGDHYGVAKDADLYFVKAYWGFIHPDDADRAEQIAAEAEEDGVEPLIPVTLSGGHRGMLSAYDQIKKIVRERDLEKKAVVLLSRPDIWATTGTRLQIETSWMEFLTWAKDSNVVVVVPSAPSPVAVNTSSKQCTWLRMPETPDQFDPSAMSYHDHREVIHARGADLDGGFFFGNGPAVLAGEPYLYAHAVDVETLAADGTGQIVSNTRTSAALIAGLAAYYLANPDYQTLYKETGWSVPIEVKRLMTSAAWTRHADGDRQTMMSGFKEEYADRCDNVEELVDIYPFAIPTSLPMIYNEAWGPQNACPHPSSLNTRQVDPDYTGFNYTFEIDQCQGDPPLASSTPLFDTSDEQETTGQSWERLLCMYFDDLDWTGKGTQAGDMTPEKCGRHCCGAMYFGLVGGTECYCLEGPGHILPQELSEECDAPRAGDEEETCGGDMSVEVYLVDQIATKKYCKGGVAEVEVEKPSEDEDEDGA